MKNTSGVHNNAITMVSPRGSREEFSRPKNVDTALNVAIESAKMLTGNARSSLCVAASFTRQRSRSA